MTVFQFRPLVSWGRPDTDPRSSGARFRAHWDDTILLLRTEAEHLGAHAVAVQVDADESMIRRDGMLRSAAIVGYPGIKVAFTSTYGPLTYATDQFDHWKANVRAIALGLQALRAVDRYGISKSGEQYRGYAAIGTAPASTSDLSVEEAHRILVEFPPYRLGSVLEIQAAFRSAAKLHHPDAGGTREGILLVTKARDVLLAAARG